MSDAREKAAFTLGFGIFNFDNANKALLRIRAISNEDRWRRMRITSTLLKDALISALADEYSRKIILKTIENAQSVEDLSRSENVPISTAYRRVNELRQVGILTVEKTILTDDGKKFELYRSAFRAVHMDLVQGELEVDVDLNEDVAARLSRLWASMRSA